MFALPTPAPRTWSLALILALSALAVSPARAQLAVGATAPDFTLIDTTGTPHGLTSDYAGEVVVLFFVGYG